MAHNQPWDLICSSLGQDCTILSISPHANSEVRPYTTALELSQYLQTVGWGRGYRSAREVSVRHSGITILVFCVLIISYWLIFQN